MGFNRFEMYSGVRSLKKSLGIEGQGHFLTLA